MVGNVGCFVSGCSNPIIGQCAGYKGSCGQFYCRTHSMGKLCDECGTRKDEGEKRQAQEAKLERMRQEYLATAEKITKRPGVSIVFAVGFTVAATVVLIFQANAPHSSGTAALLLFIATLFILYALLKYGVGKREITVAEKSRPGFREFYESFRSAEAKEDAEWHKHIALELLGGVVGGVIEGTARGIGEGAKHAVKDLSTPAESPIQLEIKALERKVDRLRNNE